MIGRLASRRRRFLSLRLKIWLGFILIITPIFLISFYWFKEYTYARVFDQISRILSDTVDGAVRGINVDHFVRLYEDESAKNPNCPPSPGSETNGYYPDDNPLYLEHVNWLNAVQQISKSTYIYTYIKGPRPGDVIGIGSTGYFLNPRAGFKFCELYNSHNNTMIYQGLFGPVNSWKVYNDKFGSWISSYRPIVDARGNIVGAIGVDISAQQLTALQNDIVFRGSVVFVTFYLVIAFLVFWLTGFLTSPLVFLSRAVMNWGDGKSAQKPILSGAKKYINDEIDVLAEAFEAMMTNVDERTRQLIHSREQLQALTYTTIKAQEDERRQVARELHDDAQHTLIVMKYELEMTRAALPPGREGDAIKEKLTYAISQIEETIEKIRNLAHSLRPPLLDVADLDLALRDLCEEIAAKTGLIIEYSGVPIENLPEDASLSLFRFLQEAFSNIIKHSGAKHVQVRLESRENLITLKVSDDGVGIKNNPVRIGNGHLGMAERFKMLGGRIEIESQAGAGAIVTASIPMNRLAEKNRDA
jgi:signal transduction histidine kinase